MFFSLIFRIHFPNNVAHAKSRYNLILSWFRIDILGFPNRHHFHLTLYNIARDLEFTTSIQCQNLRLHHEIILAFGIPYQCSIRRICHIIWCSHQMNVFKEGNSNFDFTANSTHIVWFKSEFQNRNIDFELRLLNLLKTVVEIIPICIVALIRFHAERMKNEAETTTTIIIKIIASGSIVKARLNWLVVK